MEKIKLSEVTFTSAPSSIIGLSADQNVAQVTVDTVPVLGQEVGFCYLFLFPV